MYIYIFPFGFLWVSLASLWLPLSQLWAPFGSFGSPWAPFGCSLDPFGSIWLALGLPSALFGEPLSHICNYIENLMSFTQKCIKYHEAVNKTQLLGICPWSSRSPWKWCHRVLLRPSLPHTPRVRMMGVKQTPSNYVSSPNDHHSKTFLYFQC